MRIESKNLVFTYGNNSAVKSKALNGVNVFVEEGDFFGIIGQTGSGKTTFVQHLNGLIKIQKNSGEITVGEFSLTDKKCDFKALRKNVGMVFQYPEYQLFAETVYDDVAFGIRNFLPGKSQSEIEQMVKNAIEIVGLDYQKVKDKSPFELSGGQKRRVAIAGVIVTKPCVLVLDEPAAGLDPIGKREFLKLLQNLHDDFVKTIIIVSHDMNLISEYCNKVAIFKNGRVETEGSPQTVFSSGLAESLGLKNCLTCELENQLKKNGINVNSNLTVDDFTDKVANYFKQKQKLNEGESL